MGSNETSIRFQRNHELTKVYMILLSDQENNMMLHMVCSVDPCTYVIGLRFSPATTRHLAVLSRVLSLVSIYNVKVSVLAP